MVWGPQINQAKNIEREGEGAAGGGEQQFRGGGQQAGMGDITQRGGRGGKMEENRTPGRLQGATEKTKQGYT